MPLSLKVLDLLGKPVSCKGSLDKLVLASLLLVTWLDFLCGGHRVSLVSLWGNNILVDPAWDEAFTGKDSSLSVVEEGFGEVMLFTLPYFESFSLIF